MEIFTLTKEELLQHIQTDTAEAIRSCMQGTPLDLGLLRELAKETSTPGVELFLASMPNTPSRILESLESSSDSVVLRQLAMNPNCLARMVGSASEAARLAASQSRKLSQPMALRLAEDQSLAVRVELAKNPVISTPVQLKLSQDPVPFVRIALLDNKKLVDEFQVGLGDDMDSAVHLVTLLAPRLSHECMSIWAQEGEELAQLALAHRSDLTPDIVAKLSHSPHPSVLLSLLQHQQIAEAALADFATRGDEATALAILKRPALSDELQKALWDSKKTLPSIPVAFSIHPSLGDAVGLELAESTNAEILQNLAMNLSDALQETRKRLANSNDPYLLKVLLANKLCQTPEVLEQIVLHGDDVVLCHIAYRHLDCSGLSTEAKERLSKCPMPTVRALAS